LLPLCIGIVALNLLVGVGLLGLASSRVNWQLRHEAGVLVTALTAAIPQLRSEWALRAFLESLADGGGDMVDFVALLEPAQQRFIAASQPGLRDHALEALGDAGLRTAIRQALAERRSFAYYHADQSIYLHWLNTGLPLPGAPGTTEVVVVVDLDGPAALQHWLVPVLLAVLTVGGGMLLLLLLTGLLLRRHVLGPLARLGEQLNGFSVFPPMDRLVEILDRSIVPIPGQMLEGLRLLAAAVEDARTGIVITNPRLPDNPIVYANAAFCAMSGYSLDEILGRNCRFLQDRSSPEPGRAILRTAIGAARPVTREICNIRKNGERFRNRLSILPVRDRDGRISHFVGYQEEVGDELQDRGTTPGRHTPAPGQITTQADMIKPERSFLRVVEGFSDPILMLDADLVVRYANAAVTDSFGYLPGALLRQPFPALLNPGERDVVAEQLLGALWSPGAGRRFEHRLRHLTGTWEIAETAATRLLDPTGQPILSLHIRRITAFKAAQQRLAESEQRFRHLFDHMAEGVVYQDRDGAITLANPAAEQLLGLSLAQMQGLSSLDSRWKAVYPDGSPFPGEEHPAMVALRSGCQVRDVVMGVFRPGEGNYRWLLVNAQPQFVSGEARPHQVFTTLADVTGLRTANERNRAIVESSPHGIVEIDPASQRLLWGNSAMLGMFGYEGTTLSRLRLADLHPPGHGSPLCQGKGGSAVENGPILEVACRRADDTVFFCTISPGMMQLGETTTLVAFFTDVSLERNTRLALEQSREALLQAQRIARLGSWEQDLRTGVDTWSEEIYQILESTPALTVNYSIFMEAIHPEDRQTLHRLYTGSLNEGRNGAMSFRLRMPDGRIKWVDSHWEIILDDDGVPICSRGTLQDITERKRAEEILTLSHQRFQDLFEFSSDAILIADSAGRILEVNRRVEKLFGWSGTELVGQSVELLIPDAQRQAHIRHREQFIWTENPRMMARTGTELSARHKDGTPIPVEIGLGPIRAEDGVLVAASIRDISERKKMQASFLEAQKQEALGQLTGQLAHDFNNLLGVVVGNLDLLGLDLQDNPGALGYLEAALAATTRGSNLIKRLLAVARRQSLEPRKLDINAVVEELLPLARTAATSVVRVETALDPARPIALADRNGLETAILNLVSNARDAMPGGGGMTLGSAMARVTEAHRPDPVLAPGDYVVVTVSDEGTGIPPAVLQRVFEPFFTTKEGGRGTGLGMAMVYGFARQSGGFAAIATAPGKGTTVSLYLPVAEGAVDDEPTWTPRIAGVGVGQRLLLVDDEPELLRVTARMLKDLGYRVDTALNADQALASLTVEKQAVDLLITDIVMPGMSGVDLVRRVREGLPTLPVLYTSGFNRDRLDSVTAARTLFKPFRREELAIAVQQALAERIDEPDGQEQIV